MLLFIRTSGNALDGLPFFVNIITGVRTEIGIEGGRFHLIVMI